VHIIIFAELEREEWSRNKMRDPIAEIDYVVPTPTKKSKPLFSPIPFFVMSFHRGRLVNKQEEKFIREQRELTFTR
jgi:hypothetical protein